MKIQWLRYPGGKLHAIEHGWIYSICGIGPPFLWQQPTGGYQYCKTCLKKVDKMKEKA